MAQDDLRLRIAQLLDHQFQGVLATQDAERPYTSLMAFAATTDLSGLLIATLRQSQKHHNLSRNTAVSFLVDDRGNSAADYQQASALAASGCARPVSAEELADARALFLARHPTLRAFLELEGCVLVRIEVIQYQLVTRFQAVETLVLRATG